MVPRLQSFPAAARRAEVPVMLVVSHHDEQYEIKAEVKAVLTAPDTSVRNALIAAYLDRLEAELAQTQAAVESLRNLHRWWFRRPNSLLSAITVPSPTRNGGPTLAGPSSALTPKPDPPSNPPSNPLADPLLGARARRVTRRFAEVVCPPGLRAHHRTDRVLAEFELVLGALAPGARRALTAAMAALDQGARLYPRSRGRRFARLDDPTAEAYLRALLARGGFPAMLVQRLRGLVVMCYYELSTVQREIGYDPAPYIAAVSRRRLDTFGPEIAAAESDVNAGRES